MKNSLANKNGLVKKDSLLKKETRIHFQKYLVDNGKDIKDIFIPTLKVVFGSELHSARIWKKMIERELHRELK